jgi:hypothetical protein
MKNHELNHRSGCLFYILKISINQSMTFWQDSALVHDANVGLVNSSYIMLNHGAISKLHLPSFCNFFPTSSAGHTARNEYVRSQVEI